MIHCSKCGLANRDGSKFCNECGSRLGASFGCPSCGEPNPSTARFCGFCGTRLSFESAVDRSPSALILETGDSIAPDIDRKESDLTRHAGERQVPAASQLTGLEESPPTFAEAASLSAEQEVDTANWPPPLNRAFQGQIAVVKSFEPVVSRHDEPVAGPQGDLFGTNTELLEYLAQLDVTSPEGANAADFRKMASAPVSEVATAVLEDVPELDSIADVEEIGVSDAVAEVEDADRVEDTPDDVASTSIDQLLPAWLVEAQENAIKEDATQEDANEDIRDLNEEVGEDLNQDLDESTSGESPAIAEVEPVAEADADKEAAYLSDACKAPPALPWERSDGISLAKSLASARHYASLEENEQLLPDQSAAFRTVLSRPWQPLVASPPVAETRVTKKEKKQQEEEKEKGKKKNTGFLRRALIYMLVAALIILAVLIVSKTPGLVDLRTFSTGDLPGAGRALTVHSKHLGKAHASSGPYVLQAGPTSM